MSSGFLGTEKDRQEIFPDNEATQVVFLRSLVIPLTTLKEFFNKVNF